MRVSRLILGSAVFMFAISSVATAQDAQKLFEAGNWTAVAERASSGSSEDLYLAALAHLKAGNTGGAINEMNRLRDQGSSDAWKQIGASGAAMLENNAGEAVAAGRRAAEAAGDNFFAHYQLGLAAAGANDLDTASRAFQRAVELKPDFAYAHYYAGQVLQKQRIIGQAAEHYQYFLKFAPNSPDASAVRALLRGLK